MFGKKLGRELAQYIRRTWPFALAFAVVSGLTCLMVVFDSNPVEATGTVTAIAFFIIAALVFVGRGFIHAYVSLYKNFSLNEAETPQDLHLMMWARIVAFLIFVLVAALLIFGGMSCFAWEYVRRMFAAFDTDWYYFLEFLLYLIIFACTVFIIPMAFLTSRRFDGKRMLTAGVGAVTLLFCLSTIEIEVFLLIRSPSTDMNTVWTFIVVFLVLFVAVDIRMYVVTYRTLKNVVSKNTERIQPDEPSNNP